MDCKKLLLESLGRFLGPIRARRAALEANPDRVWEMLRDGNRKAREQALETLTLVRERINLEYRELGATRR